MSAVTGRCDNCERAVMYPADKPCALCGPCSEARAEGADRERRRVCEWLRTPAAADHVVPNETIDMVCAAAAAAIERGEHVKEDG